MFPKFEQALWNGKLEGQRGEKRISFDLNVFFLLAMDNVGQLASFCNLDIEQNPNIVSEIFDDPSFCHPTDTDKTDQYGNNLNKRRFSDQVSRWLSTLPLFANYGPKVEPKPRISLWFLSLLTLFPALFEALFKVGASLFTSLDNAVKEKANKNGAWWIVRLLTGPLKILIGTPLALIGVLLSNVKGLLDGVGNFFIGIVFRDSKRIAAGVKCFGKNLAALIPTALIIGGIFLLCALFPPATPFLLKSVPAFIKAGTIMSSAITAACGAGISCVVHALNTFFKFVCNTIYNKCKSSQTLSRQAVHEARVDVPSSPGYQQGGVNSTSIRNKLSPSDKFPALAVQKPSPSTSRSSRNDVSPSRSPSPASSGVFSYEGPLSDDGGLSHSASYTAKIMA